jgi:alpha-tubulin suppressor-like RCC1 family protein
VWTWGAGTQGILGDGTTADKSSPVSVVGGFTDWISANSNGGHNVGLRANGTAWSWGFNTDGRLGDGTTTARSSPVSVVGGFTDWTSVVGGGFFSLGIRANGTAWALGGVGGGALGDGTTVSKSSPVSVVGGFTDWIQLSAGNSHSLAIRGS